MNHNEHERISRKGAKAQRREDAEELKNYLSRKLSSRLSLRLCAFAGDFFFPLLKLSHYR
jgi:hypothetical protein